LWFFFGAACNSPQIFDWPMNSGLCGTDVDRQKDLGKFGQPERNNMLANILIALAVVAGAFAVLVARRPSEFRVVRSAIMEASPAAVFARVNDFRKWEAWNPWGKIDPAMKQTYQGAPAGTGAIYTWAGNREVGEGRMTITESRPNDLIRIKLEFFKPFAAVNTAEFTFTPEPPNRTAVTWSMTGTNNFAAKAVHLFMNMDKMVGDQFDKGLASMKAVVEAASPTR
jgi:hypothetical protein